MRCLKLTISYDGTSYAGWQSQREEDTVQDRLEKGLAIITGRHRRTIASGRTDAGVHALGQVVSARTDSTLPCDVLLRAINANLPDDIRVLRVEEASPDFHAIRDAICKRYRYVLQDGPIPDIFSLRHSWYVPADLDEVAMTEAASYLTGRHDFASFQSSGSPRTSTVRTVLDLVVKRQLTNTGRQLIIEVEADGFLYNMVRNLVGTLMYVGRGKHPAPWVQAVLARRDRRLAGPTAPPQGLFLMSVTYPPSPNLSAPFRSPTSIDRAEIDLADQGPAGVDPAGSDR